MKMTTNGQSQSAKKVYQKATMEIVEIGAVDVMTASFEGTVGDTNMFGSSGESFKKLNYKRVDATNGSDYFAD